MYWMLVDRDQSPLEAQSVAKKLFTYTLIYIFFCAHYCFYNYLLNLIFITIFSLLGSTPFMPISIHCNNNCLDIDSFM